MRAIWSALLVPLLLSASELEFRASDKEVFVVREPTFAAASSRVPLFRATVDDRTGLDWDEVHVDVTVNLTCGSTTKNLSFTASLGNLVAGDNEVSDAVVSARGILDSGCKAAGFAFKLKSGHPVMPEVSAEREQGRKDEADKASKAMAEVDSKVEKEVDLIEICHKVYRLTIDKKVSDLTVADSRAIKSCEALGYYWD